MTLHPRYHACSTLVAACLCFNDDLRLGKATRLCFDVWEMVHRLPELGVDALRPRHEATSTGWQEDLIFLFACKENLLPVCCSVDTLYAGEIGDGVVAGLVWHLALEAVRPRCAHHKILKPSCKQTISSSLQLQTNFTFTAYKDPQSLSTRVW